MNPEEFARAEQARAQEAKEQQARVEQARVELAQAEESKQAQFARDHAKIQAYISNLKNSPINVTKPDISRSNKISYLAREIANHLDQFIASNMHDYNYLIAAIDVVSEVKALPPKRKMWLFTVEKNQLEKTIEIAGCYLEGIATDQNIKPYINR